jgi:hypothetical protein
VAYGWLTLSQHTTQWRGFGAVFLAATVASFPGPRPC